MHVYLKVHISITRISGVIHINVAKITNNIASGRILKAKYLMPMCLKFEVFDTNVLRITEIYVTKRAYDCKYRILGIFYILFMYYCKIHRYTHMCKI